MPPRLVIGIGSPSSPEAGAGAAVVRRLRLDPRLPDGVEVRQDSELLRLLDVLRGRGHVVLVDAAPGLPSGGVFVHDDPIPFAGAGSGDAKQLSGVKALSLLRLSDPMLRGVRFTWVLLPAESLVGGAPPGDLVEDAVEGVLGALGAISAP